MPVPPNERLPRIRSDRRPAWADITDRFYANSFDAADTAALTDSAEAWAAMEPEEQSFHAAHLAFRQIQALTDIHASLQGVERRLAAFDPAVLGALKHLPGVRKALVVIARGQRDMVDLLEAGAGGGSSGPEGDEDDDGDEVAGADESELDDSDLRDVVDIPETDADEVVEEDYGHGDVESVVPDLVLPAPARRSPLDSQGGEA